MIGLAFLGDDLSRRAMEETSDQRRRAVNFAADVMYYHSASGGGAEVAYKAALDELRWAAGMLAGVADSLEVRLTAADKDAS